ncbi:MAG: hypothetical protein GX076_04640 [Clostridiales bacterium]|nr:hypothetical protein [Clostridiales bacterium]
MKKLLVIIIMVIAFMMPITAYADMGPKDSLTVYVINPPAETYYLDLLTQKAESYNNFHEGEREKLNQNMLSLLYSYENEGWKPALVEGTGLPMWGDLIGKPSEKGYVHKFGYVGVPDVYRIIIVTESGNVSVSDVLTRKSLYSSVTYDYSTGHTTVPSLWNSYLVQFFTTLIPTLIIEGIILLLFGFALRENLKIFILTNIVTQIVLTLTVGLALIRSGPITAYLFQFPIEVIILIIESIIFARYLKGNSRKRRIAYGIVANLASWGFGFFFLSHQFILLSKIM